jgi:4-amino-4-deoxy-L-arabinose transferase-like glycosyltransferase
MTSRGWVVLVGILTSAVVLRLWGITFGLPYDLTADEPHQIIQALKIGTGQGGPLVRMWHTVGKSGLDLLLFVEYGVLFAFWWVTGQVDGPRAFALRYLTDPTAFYLVGRITVALLGAFTALAVFHVGRRIYGTRVGLGAAAIAAVAHFHIAESHVIGPHIPMTFALWTGVAAYLTYEASRRTLSLIVAGLFCGAAIALAYSAAIGLLMLLGVRLFTTGESANWHRRLTDAAILAGAALVSIAVMSPDLLTQGSSVLRNFASANLAGSPETDVRGAIDSVTILRQQNWTGFFDLLLKPDTAILTLAAFIGAIAGLVRKERWTNWLSLAIAVFLLIVSASSRGLSESYLLPVTPAIWLLASRGIAAASANRLTLYVAGTAVVAAIPLFFAAREDMMLAKPDTRVLAKHWIEENVPSGSTILMDGMRFRFVQGVPLNGDRATVARRLADLKHSELVLSDDMLSLYRQAAEQVNGPTYDLRSTVYGLEVDSLDQYVRMCVPYVVVSSFNEKRYQSEDASRLHPNSARFYRDIRTDPRFRVVYEVGPVMWQQLGPTITVYRVVCGRSSGDIDHTS